MWSSGITITPVLRGALAVVSAVALAIVVTGCGRSKQHANAASVPVVTVTPPTQTETLSVQSSSMEPTLHCAGAPGCEATTSDRVVVTSPSGEIQRGEIVVFKTPPEAQARCGAGGTFVSRPIGLPGDTWSERNGYVYINGKRLNEPYIKANRRDTETLGPRPIGKGMYFMMGDNRLSSCDSRVWGAVPRKNLIGEVFATYWPPNRISIYSVYLSFGLGALGLLRLPRRLRRR
jgi:signal peptidase I